MEGLAVDLRNLNRSPGCHDSLVQQSKGHSNSDPSMANHVVIVQSSLFCNNSIQATF